MSDQPSTTQSADTDGQKESKGGGHHTLYMIGAIVAALLIAWQFPNFAMSLDLGGQVFLRLLMMIVVPLVMASVMSGILGLGDVRKLGKPGATAIGYYFMTTVLAVTIGMIVVNVFQPGVGFKVDQPKSVAEASEDSGDDPAQNTDENREGSSAETETAESGEEGEKPKEITAPEDAPKNLSDIFRNLVLTLFTNNLLQSMANGDLLPLIVFSIVFAGMLTTMGERAKTLSTLIEAANDALLSFIMLLMKFAPLGIFCLVAAQFGEFFAEEDPWDKLSKIGLYMITVLTGLGIHAFVVLPLILWYFTKRNPVEFFKQMSDALLTAFSTASSSATLPVTMECAEKNAGVSRRSTEFVLPLGATINMDGTALYEAAAAIFMAQIHAGLNPDFEFGFAQQLTIAVTATLAAIGAAGIPEAGLVTMVIVLNAVGLPLDYLPLILPIDWLLDRFRTATNTFGDSVGSAVVDQTFPDSEAA
jgi:solute carrier family 1 (high affinity glutamate transporter) protein 1